MLRIRDVYPGSRILIFTHPGSQIPDPGSRATKEGGEKKFVVITFYIATNFTKLQIILVLKCWRKKIWANFQSIIELFTPQEIVIRVNKLSKIWVWDPGSGIRDPEKTHSGSRIQGSKRHQIPDPDPQHWFFSFKYFKIWGRKFRVKMYSQVFWDFLSLYMLWL